MKPVALIAFLSLITLSATSQQIYLADNGLTATGSGVNKKVSLGGTLTGNTAIPFAGVNLTFTGNGNIGIRNALPFAPLHVTKNVSGNYNPTMIVEDALSDGFVMFQMRGPNKRFNLGVGNGTWFDLQNDFFIWDDNFSLARLVVASNGNVGIGVNDPASKLSIAGPSAGTSGLQFTQLNNSSGSIAGNGKVLGLDATGNVILVNDQGAGTSWGMSGNAGTNPDNNFIGTTDGQDLRFRVNNEQKMAINGLGELWVGPASGFSGYKLNVTGSAHVSNNLMLGNSFAMWSGSGSLPGTPHQGIYLDFNNQASAVRFKTTWMASVQDNWTFENVNGLEREFSGSGSGASIIRIAQGWAGGDNGAEAATLRIQNSINNNSGHANTIRGIYYNPQLTNMNNVTHIAYENVHGNNRLNSTSGNTLIGTSTDNGSKLQVAGNLSTTNFQMTDGAGSGEMLFSDANGNAAWHLPDFELWVMGGNDHVNGAFGTKIDASIPVITNNQLRMWISNAGNIGIGLNFTAPEELLHVNGKIRANQLKITTGAAAGKVLTSDADGNATWQTATGGGSNGWSLGGNTVGSPTEIGTSDAQPLPFITSGEERMRIDANGNVGINTTDLSDPAYRFFVEGAVRARKVRVDNNTWPDYVFSDTYRLRPLSEVEKHIRSKKHLPEVPSAAEVEKKGIDLGDNQAILLKKIEELTLYIIQQNKKLEDQQKRIELLEKKIK